MYQIYHHQREKATRSPVNFVTKRSLSQDISRGIISDETPGKSNREKLRGNDATLTGRYIIFPPCTVDHEGVY